MLDDLLKTKSRAIRGLSSDDILSLLGLERRHTVLDNAIPTGVAFVAGLAAGAGIALLLAPKSGREMRQDISSRANELSSRIGTTANELAADARSALGMSSTSSASSASSPASSSETRALTGTNRTS